MSNILFFANAMAPLTITWMFAIYFRLLRVRSSALVLIGWPAAAAGALLNRVLFNTTGLGSQSKVSVDRALTSLDVFLRGAAAKIASGDMLHLLALLWTVVCVGFVLAVLRAATWRGTDRVPVRTRMMGMLFLSCLLSSVCGIGAIVVGGSNGLLVFKDYVWTMHYLHPTFLLPLFGLPVLLAWCVERVHARFARPASAASAALACALPLYGLITTHVPAALVHAQVPPLVRFMDDLAVQEHLKYGLAGYWQARPLTLLSRKGLRAYAVDGAMKPLLWVSNRQWYDQVLTSDGKAKKIDFVVLDDPLWKLSKESAIKILGEPRQEVSFQNIRVLIYSQK
jgi:hypothetical protein